MEEEKGTVLVPWERKEGLTTQERVFLGEYFGSGENEGSVVGSCGACGRGGLTVQANSVWAAGLMRRVRAPFALVLEKEGVGLPELAKLLAAGCRATRRYEALSAKLGAVVYGEEGPDHRARVPYLEMAMKVLGLAGKREGVQVNIEAVNCGEVKVGALFAEDEHGG